MSHHEVIVIGGGQAGLAIGYLARAAGRDFTILEAAGEPAAAWRGALGLAAAVHPARHDGLPGLDFPGDPARYPVATRSSTT